MVEINLFPWRERRRDYELRTIKKIIILSFLLPALLLLASYSFLLYQIDQVKLQTTALKIQLKADLKKQIAPASLPAHAQKNLPDTSHARAWLARSHIQTFLMALGQQRLTAICFNEIQRQHNVITITGDARSSFAFSQFIQQWRPIQFFSELIIDEMQEQKNGELQFRLHGQLQSQEREENKDDI